MIRQFKVTLIIENDFDDFFEAQQDALKANHIQDVLSCKHIYNARTLRQNNALHKYFEMASVALNDAGYDIKKTLNSKLEHPWNGERFKELIWRPVQEACLGKKSTTELCKAREIDIVYEVINKHLSEKYGIYVPFPSEEYRGTAA
ncbi:MAG TPA: hypothetical protein PLY95_03520 [Candidatus Paceibacterota bacterium]|nr:hypothetical protein [Candidatus Paceibacterota bacterium]